MTERGRRYLHRGLLACLLMFTAIGQWGCGVTPTKTLDCKSFELTGFPRTCTTFFNSCEDNLWIFGDSWEIVRLFSDITIETITTDTTLGLTVDRQLCVGANVSPFTDNLQFRYARRGFWGQNYLRLTVGVPLTVSAAAIPTVINPAQFTQLAATAAGGQPPYTYLWLPADAYVPDANASNPGISILTTRNFTVYVTDSAGNTANANVTVNVNTLLNVTAVPAFIAPGQQSLLTADVLGGSPPYTFAWTPAASLDNAARQAPIATPATTTTYNVTVTDNSGTVVTGAVQVTVDLVVIASATPPSISTGGMSQLNAAVSGGTPPYTYHWTPATGLVGGTDIPNPTASPAAMTTYTVQVTDAVGTTRMATATVNVTGPSGPSACFTWTFIDSVVFLDASCSTASVSIVQYAWNFMWNGDPTQPFDEIDTGPTGAAFFTSSVQTTRLRVTDVNGLQAFVTHPTP